MASKLHGRSGNFVSPSLCNRFIVPGFVCSMVRMRFTETRRDEVGDNSALWLICSAISRFPDRTWLVLALTCRSDYGPPWYAITSYELWDIGWVFIISIRRGLGDAISDHCTSTVPASAFSQVFQRRASHCCFRLAAISEKDTQTFYLRV